MKRRLIYTSLGSAAALLILLNVASEWTVVHIIDSVDEEREGHENLHTLDDARDAMKDAQRGERSFLVTGEPHYLETYQNGLTELHDDLLVLARAVRGDVEQERHIEAIRRSNERFIRITRDAISARGAGPLDLPNLRGTAAHDKQIVDEISALLDQMVAHQRQDLAGDAVRLRRMSHYALEMRIVLAAAIIALMAMVLITMRREIIAKARAQRETAAANAELSRNLVALESHSRERHLLTEMSELLQLCVTSDEAREILPSFLQQLFPGVDGAVYVIRASDNSAEVSAAWGAEPEVAAFAPSDCWGLRRGRAHAYIPGTSMLACRHAVPGCGAVQCIPMVAQGETVGLLQLRAQSGGTLPDDDELPRAVADQISLAMANLRLQETLRVRAVRDPLTGLFNRRYMEESLDRELRRADRKGAQVGVIMIDLDHFKHFNDTFGHAGGDALLQQFAQLMQSLFRDEDIACRYGGEEFVVVIPEASVDVVRNRADRLRDETRKLHVRTNGQPLGAVTASVGFAVSPQHGVTSETLVGAADAALYEAKRAGRDRVCSAGPAHEMQLVASA